MWGESHFIQLTVHHIATICAIFWCYYTNSEDLGPFILIASDCSDAILNFAKAFRDVQGGVGRLADVIFTIVIVSWFITRNLFLAGCWYHAIKQFHPFGKIMLKDSKYDHL
jgi:hypothetical protein